MLVSLLGFDSGDPLVSGLDPVLGSGWEHVSASASEEVSAWLLACGLDHR